MIVNIEKITKQHVFFVFQNSIVRKYDRLFGRLVIVTNLRLLQLIGPLLALIPAT